MATVQVKLKRHLDHKSDYMYERIRPAVVCDALRCLIDAPLNRKYGIYASSSYMQTYFGQYDK